MALTFSNKFYFANGHWTKNPMLLTISTNNLMSGGSRRPNFSIVLDGSLINIFGTSISEYFSSLSLIPDDAGNVTLDLRYIVDSICEKYADTTNLTDRFSESTIATYGDVEVIIVAQERYGATPTLQGSAATLNKLACWGAVNNQDDSTPYTLASQIPSYVDTRPILTNMAQYGKLRYNQNQYLTYYNNQITGSFTNVGIQFKVVLSDGIEGLWNPTNAIAPLNCNEYNRVTFKFSPLSLGLTTNTSLLAVRFINGSETPLSDWQNFTIDYDKKECDKQFLFINQFGCPEIIYANGRNAELLEITRNTVNSGVYTMSSSLYLGKKQRGSTVNKAMLLRSGYISKDDLIQWQELLASNHVYELTTAVVDDEIQTSYAAVIFRTDKFKVSECGQYLHSFEAEYEYSYPLTSMDKPKQIISDTSTIETFKPQSTVDTATYTYLN